MGRFGRWIARLVPVRSPVLNIAGDVGEGPVIILVHGIASSAATFDQLIPLICDRYRCISIDLLGFGASPAPKNARYTVEEHVAAIHATVRSLRLRAPFVLIGHSLGALLSARFAAQHPEQVSRLLLVSPPVYLAPSEIADPWVRAQLSAYLRAYEFLRLNKRFTTAAAERIGKLLQLTSVFEITENNWTSFVLSLKNCIEAQTTVSDIALIRVPIDVLYGTLDQFIAVGTMRIVGQMRHVTMHRVRGNDHVMRKRLSKAVAQVLA